MQGYIYQDWLNKYSSITKQPKIQESILKGYLSVMHVLTLMNAIPAFITLGLLVNFCIREDLWTKINTNNTKQLAWPHRVRLVVLICSQLFSKILLTHKPTSIMSIPNATRLCILPNTDRFFGDSNRNFILIIKIHKDLNMSWDVLTQSVLWLCLIRINTGQHLK